MMHGTIGENQSGKARFPTLGRNRLTQGVFAEIAHTVGKPTETDIQRNTMEFPGGNARISEGNKYIKAKISRSPS